MIEIRVLASGSSGNCYRISDGETVIMIECGIRFQEIREAFDFKLSDVSACLISHSHKDHCNSVKQIARAGIDIWMSYQTMKEIGTTGHRINAFEPKEVIEIGSFKILPFLLQHDVENHGFLMVGKNGEKLCYITDTYYCKYRFTGVNYYMIECNYYRPQLERNIKAEVVSEAIKNRVIKSHFEIENVKEFFLANDLSSVKQIHLIHISNTNGDSDFFKREIQELTGKEVYCA